MSHAVITVKGLKKSFKDNEVLKGVDFEVRRGEIFALLGSNGAGKTTTVNILSTLMKPDGGEVGICGFDVQREPDHQQGVSDPAGLVHPGHHRRQGRRREHP